MADAEPPRAPTLFVPAQAAPPGSDWAAAPSAAAPFAAAPAPEAGAAEGPGTPSPVGGIAGGEPSAAAVPKSGVEVVLLRVPDTRHAIALHAAVAALAGVRTCNLREFERGRLVLDVEHEPGAPLADRVRALNDFDIRLTSARDEHLEFQVL